MDEEKTPVEVEPQIDGLDGSISDVATPARARRGLVPILGGVVLAGVLIAIQASSSSETGARARGTNDLEAQIPRTPAPPMQPLPIEVPAAERAQVAAPPLEPSPFEEQLAYDLQRQAMENVEERQRLADQRRRAPMVLYDRKVENSAAEGRAVASTVPSPQSILPAAFSLPSAEREQPELSREERFTQDALAPVETVSAERIEHPSTVVPQGTLIQGVLETEIQSDLPGMIRAQVSEPVRSFDGTLLVPRGSKLIGKYQSGLVRGQTRVFVIWTRLVRPDGVSMQIASPGSDMVGVSGVGGDVDTHFFEIFGSSLLLSLIGGGVDLGVAKAQDNDNSTIIRDGGDDFGRASELALQNRINIPPTIRVARGTPIQVVVSKDLDFGVRPAPAP